MPPSGQYVYYPGTSEVPERSAANVHNVSYKVLAEVELTPTTEGVIFAHGSRFGGHALFVKDGTVTYAYNFLGIPPGGPHPGARCRPPGRHIIGVEFTKERMGEYREGIGPLKLYIDDQLVAEQEIRTVMGHFSLCGEGLCIGYDSGDAVSTHVRGLAVRLHRTARSRRSSSTSPTTPTSTSRRTSRPRWRATDAVADDAAAVLARRRTPATRHPRLRRGRHDGPDAVPVAERIAVFDNDGTLWTEKPMPTQLHYIVQHGRPRRRRIQSLAESQPYEAAVSGDLGWLGGAIDKHYAGDDSDLKAMIGAIIGLTDGTSRRRLRRVGRGVLP